MLILNSQIKLGNISLDHVAYSTWTKESQVELMKPVLFVHLVLLMSYLDDIHLFIYLQNAMEIALLFNYMPADSKYDIFKWQRYLLLEFKETGLHINAHGNILKCLIKTNTHIIQCHIHHGCLLTTLYQCCTLCWSSLYIANFYIVMITLYSTLSWPGFPGIIRFREWWGRDIYV